MNKTIANMTIKEFKEIGAKPDLPLCGKKVSILTLFDKTVIILAWKLCNVEDRKTIKLQLILEEDKDEKVLIVFTSSSTIRKQLEQVNIDDFPIKAKIKKQGDAFYLE